MFRNTLDVAETWYSAVQEKNFEKMSKCLHPEVQFKAPLREVKGKEAVLEASRDFALAIKGLKICSKFGSEDQAMLSYEVEFPAPVGKVPSAVLLSFKDGLIAKFELFFDARKFDMNK